MLEIPASFDRSKGDVHSMGNPHFLIDPLNAKVVAARLADRFSRIDPGSAALYRSNLASFNARIDSKLAEWRRRLAPFRDAKIVTYHNDFVYLANRFNLDVVATLEPKPGISPSASHLARVIGTMKSRNARVILVQPYQNRRTAETVARQTGAAVLDVPQQPGARPRVSSYFDLLDYMVNTLATALSASR
jgi:ABC-type Zn uptake system ZnuABC Zn-binding protein ZnuA